MRHLKLITLTLALCLFSLTLTPVVSVSPAALVYDRSDAHPLDPLSETEMETALNVLKASPDLPSSVVYPYLALREPPKDVALKYRPGEWSHREAVAEVFDPPSNRLWEAVIDLKQATLVSLSERPGVQPAAYFTEFDQVEEVVRADPQWQAAMQRRGITDLDDVYLDIWTGGDLPIPGAPEGGRIMRMLSFYRGKLPNPYNRPIEGVIVAVDANAMRVVEVTDTVVAPISMDTGDPDGSTNREPLKPLRVVQPDGPSFTVRGHEIRWQNWRFRYALLPREGLTLYTVSYGDGGRQRSILYRASLSEIFVPYGLPDGNWAWRTAFDVGEWGMGRNTLELEPGRDVPAHATFFDAVLADDTGFPYTIANAVALYEREGGLLWKRVDPSDYTPDTRLARDLVLYSNTTIGNYTYGLSWIFRQNGSIEVEVELSGTLLLRGVMTDAAGDEFGTLVSEYVSAPNHQHFFNFRLDLDVEDVSNSVVEVNARPVPVGPRNSFGNGWEVTETLLRTELDGQRDLNPASLRRWKVINPAIENPLGHAVGYALVPGENSVPYAAVEFPPRAAAGFVDHHVWVTAYDPTQMYAAGPYPNQGRAGEGLPEWVADNASLVGKDVVVWYTLGVSHNPEPEEYPVMTAHRAGFRLTPDGFFTRNPALDVSAPEAPNRKASSTGTRRPR